MPKLISDLLEGLISKGATWLFIKASEFIQGRQRKAVVDSVVEARLAKLRQAYGEAFDGKPITPEQREALNQAVSDFLRNPDNGGL